MSKHGFPHDVSFFNTGDDSNELRSKHRHMGPRSDRSVRLNDPVGYALGRWIPDLLQAALAQDVAKPLQGTVWMKYWWRASSVCLLEMAYAASFRIHTPLHTFAEHTTK